MLRMTDDRTDDGTIRMAHNDGTMHGEDDEQHITNSTQGRGRGGGRGGGDTRRRRRR